MLLLQYLGALDKEKKNRSIRIWTLYSFGFNFLYFIVILFICLIIYLCVKWFFITFYMLLSFYLIF